MKKFVLSCLIIIIFPTQSFANSKEMMSELNTSPIMELMQKFFYKYKIFSTGNPAKTYNGYKLLKSVKVKNGYIGFYS